MPIDLEHEMPWMNEDEKQRCLRYESMSDEEVLGVLRRQAARLDHLPAKYEIPDAAYFKRRFGPWPRVLELAGLKPVSPRKMRYREPGDEAR